jgi:predicted metal-binding membrane protein
VSAVASSSVRSEGATGLRPAYLAARARLGLIALLFALAVVAWWSTAQRMSGMDDGPGTALGALGWFLGVWVVMMAAMMFPSVAPTVALYAQMSRRRSPVAPLVFASGYLVTWAGAGLVAYGVYDVARSLVGDQLTWDGAGRWIAGGTLIVAALYELTPMKNVCLSKCRSPLGFLVGSWRDGLGGAFEMGARHGSWCVGCCWALMASLFALGVMSLAWMAFVAALIALEKTVPWGRAVMFGTAALLLVVGVMLIAAPDAIPGLTLPGHGSMGGGSMDMGSGSMEMH